MKRLPSKNISLFYNTIYNIKQILSKNIYLSLINFDKIFFAYPQN